jgi:hypothetical protein
MAHFAQLDSNNVVMDVVVIDNSNVDNLPFPESEPIGIQYLTTWSGGYTNWKQTSYNGTYRKNYAGVGYKYDPNLDAFISIQDYPSWVLNVQTCNYEAPFPPPDDGQEYIWDEQILNWVLG